MSDIKVDSSGYFQGTTGGATPAKPAEPKHEHQEPARRTPKPKRDRRWLPPALLDWRNLIVAALVLTFVWDHMPNLRREDKDRRTNNANAAVEAGKAWREPLCAAYRDGFTAAADAIHAGKSIADADALLKNTADRARQDSFYRVCSPVLSAIIPEPDQHTSQPPVPPTAEQLKQFEQAMRDLATGVSEKINERSGLFGN